MIHEETELMGVGSWRFMREKEKLQGQSRSLSFSQFIRTSICTSLALVSPAMRYGIIPAKVIRARAWLRRICACKCQRHTAL